jgi:hypothetical protein
MLPKLHWQYGWRCDENIIMTQVKNRTIPLTQGQINEWFEDHLPYQRVSLTNHLRLCENPGLFGTMTEDERHRVRICAYEIGVLTCRKFVEFLGLSIKYKPYRLVEKRDYYTALEDGNSYEVKVVDLGGKWIEIVRLTDDEKNILTKIYLTGHRATVHLTDGSPYQGEWKIFHDAVKLVDRLLKEQLFDIVAKTSTLQ